MTNNETQPQGSSPIQELLKYVKLVVVDTFGQVAAVVGFLTVAGLVFNLNFNGLGDYVLAAYGKLVHFFTGWLDPLVFGALHLVGDWLNLDITLHPYWRYVLFLISLYIGTDVALDIQRKRLLSAALTIVAGLLFASIVGTWVGAIPTASAPRIMLVAITGWTLYELFRAGLHSQLIPFDYDRVHPKLDPDRGRKIQTFEHYFGRFAVTDFWVGGLCIAIVAVTQPAGQWRSAMAGLLLFIVLMAVRNLVQAAEMRTKAKDESKSWFGQLWTYATAQFAFKLLGVIIAAVLLVPLLVN